MENEIYYISGTGTSKAIATELATKLSQTKLIPLFENSGRKIVSEAKTVGFVFPIHSLGIPRVLEQVIRDIDISEVRYIYAIATMGGAYGIAFEQIGRLIRKKGHKLSATLAIAFGSNSNLFMKIPGTTPILPEVEQEECFVKAKQKLEVIAKTIQMRGVSYESAISINFKIISRISHKAFIWSLPKFDKGFHTENCNNCGICVKACPVKNIELGANGPIWKGNCEACLRCFNACSEKAILLGKMDEPKMHERYTRYLDLVIKA